MKKIALVIAVLFAGSCTRHHLNYQSSHPNGPSDQDNYPAPQTQNMGGGVQNNYSNGNNYNSESPQVDYSSPSYQTFYDGLSPYGNWVNYPAYGYAWVPNAGPGFSPYSTNGNWIYTSYGWTWNSGYDWGWAPFHYGRWFIDPAYGWIWVPGYQWAPAWVSWGSYNGYYGWAPVEPGVIVSSGYSPPQQYWRFVPAENITSTNLSNYYVSNNTVQRNNVVLINNASAYDEHTYFTGPQRDEVEVATGSKVNTVIVHESNKPTPVSITNNNITLYRPAIEQNTAKTAAPAKITPVESLKPVKSNTEPGNNLPATKPVAEPENNSPPPHISTHTQTESTPQHPVNNKPQQQGPKPASKPKNNQQPGKREPSKKG